MPSDTLLLALYLIPLLLILGIYIARQQSRTRRNQERLDEAFATGLHEPASLHPVIDNARCIGCGACVNACPEHDVLGLIQTKATLIGPANCIGHGACQKACPVGAIELVFGTATRGVDIPKLSPDFQTTIPGIFIAGELGGMGLIRNAIEQGRQAMDAIIDDLPKRRANNLLDVIIVGAGPAGLSASLAAKSAGIRALTLDQESSLGGTVAHFPRGKLVMTQPATLALVGKVRLTETSKESLLAFWNSVLEQHPVELRFDTQVQKIEKSAQGFVVMTNKAQYECQRVLLAIGRRGSPRKLNIPGEDLPKVVYRLIDPEQYQGQSVLVVGGGDSALEAAISVALEPDTHVTLVHRSEGFNRAKSKNLEKLKQLVEAKRLQVLMKTSPIRIESDSVILNTPDGTQPLANDAVIICAGGELPTGFLQQIGIAVETKYGTA